MTMPKIAIHDEWLMARHLLLDDGAPLSRAAAGGNRAKLVTPAPPAPGAILGPDGNPSDAPPASAALRTRSNRKAGA
jgi:hypothetical protein